MTTKKKTSRALVPEAHSAALTADDVQSLLSIGVTLAQVNALRRRMRSIAYALADPVPMADVRDVLIQAHDHAAALAKIADLGEGKKAPAHRLALAYFGGVSGSVECEAPDESGPGTLPEVPDFAAAARMLRNMTALALDDLTKLQRRGRRDPARAVDLLLTALREPDDDASRAFAKRVSPTALPSASNPFHDIATTVFARAARGFCDLRAAVDAWRKWRSAMRCRPAVVAIGEVHSATADGVGIVLVRKPDPPET